MKKNKSSCHLHLKTSESEVKQKQSKCDLTFETHLIKDCPNSQ